MEKYFASDDGIKELAKKKSALNKNKLSGCYCFFYQSR